MAKAARNEEAIRTSAGPVDASFISSADEQEGNGNGTQVARQSAGKRGKKKTKGPRTAYYLVLGLDKVSGEQAILGEAPTKGRIVKLWMQVHQIAVRQYRDFAVVRVKPLEELGGALFSPFKR